MADSKVTALTAATSYDGADLLYFVDTVAGNVSKKITLSTLRTDAAFTGETTLGDANFSAEIVTSNPRFTFDSTDYLEYDRASNYLNVIIGGANQGTFYSDGFNFDDGKYISVGTSIDSHWSHDSANTYLQNLTGNFYMLEQVNSGYFYFQTKDSTGTLESVLHLGGATPSFNLYYDGGIAVSGSNGGIKINNDAAFLISMTGIHPIFTMDSGSDYMYYHRTNNEYHFLIAGSETAIFKSNTININIPTSSAGLSSGDLWNDSGTVKIV